MRAPSARRVRSMSRCWRPWRPERRPSTSGGTPPPRSSPTRWWTRCGPRSRSGPRSARAEPSSAAGRGLPELEPSAFRVDRPAEAPELRLLECVDPLDARRAQLGQHRVQVGDAEVHHERLLRPPEVLGVVIEDGPRRGTAGRPLERLAAPLGEVDAEMPGIPAAQARGLPGALEPPADPGDSLHARGCYAS